MLPFTVLDRYTHIKFTVSVLTREKGYNGVAIILLLA